MDEIQISSSESVFPAPAESPTMESIRTASLDITECEILEETPTSSPPNLEKGHYLRQQFKARVLLFTEQFARSRYLFLPGSRPPSPCTDDEKSKNETKWGWGLVCAVIIGLLLADLAIRTIPWPRPVYSGAMDYSKAPIILVGDSITQYGMIANRTGWTTLMSCSYALRYDVLNRGHAGINTDTYAPMLRETIKSALGQYDKPTMVTLMLGTKYVVVLL